MIDSKGNSLDFVPSANLHYLTRIDENLVKSIAPLVYTLNIREAQRDTYENSLVDNSARPIRIANRTKTP